MRRSVTITAAAALVIGAAALVPRLVADEDGPTGNDVAEEYDYPPPAPHDVVWALVDGGTPRAEAVLDVLQSQLEDGPTGELTGLLILANQVVEEDGPQAKQVQDLLDRLVPDVPGSQARNASSARPLPASGLTAQPVAVAQDEDGRDCSGWYEGYEFGPTPALRSLPSCLSSKDVSGVTPRATILWPDPDKGDYSLYEDELAKHVERFVPIAEEALSDWMPKFTELGPMPRVQVLWDPRGGDEGLKGDRYGSYGWAWRLNSNRCHISIQPSVFDDALPTQDIKAVVVHELAHCLQYRNVHQRMRERNRDWMVEGGAEFFMKLAGATDSLLSQGSPVDTKHCTDTKVDGETVTACSLGTVLRESYNFWRYWHYVTEGDPAEILELWKSLPKDSANDPKWLQNRKDEFHSFITAANEKELDGGKQYWPLWGDESRQRALVDFSEGETEFTSEPRQAAGRIAELEIDGSSDNPWDHAVEITVTFNGSSGGVADWRDTEGNHQDLPVCIHAGDPLGEAIISATTETEFTIMVTEQTPKDSCTPCPLDPPPEGWHIEPDAFDKIIRECTLLRDGYDWVPGSGDLAPTWPNRIKVPDVTAGHAVPREDSTCPPTYACSSIVEYDDTGATGYLASQGGRTVAVYLFHNDPDHSMWPVIFVNLHDAEQGAVVNAGTLDDLNGLLRESQEKREGSQQQ